MKDKLKQNWVILKLNLRTTTTLCYLTDWFDAHPAEAKNIISKAQSAAAARIAARKAREATRRKGVLESTSMPGKLH